MKEWPMKWWATEIYHSCALKHSFQARVELKLLDDKLLCVKIYILNDKQDWVVISQLFKWKKIKNLIQFWAC